MSSRRRRKPTVHAAAQVAVGEGQRHRAPRAIIKKHRRTRTGRGDHPRLLPHRRACGWAGDQQKRRPRDLRHVRRIQLFAIVIPPDVWVIANFKETQLSQHAAGPAGDDFKVDAYPDREFHGTVESIQAGTGSRFSVIPSENATGNFVKVVRAPAGEDHVRRSDVNSDPNHLLSPGMSVSQPKVRVREGSVRTLNHHNPSIPRRRWR